MNTTTKAEDAPKPEAPVAQLVKIRDHCLTVGRAMGLPEKFAQQCERTPTPDLVLQMLTGLKDANEHVLEALDKAKRALQDAGRREAALRAEVITLAERKG